MITTLLLAAGRGERFGAQKLLAKLPDGSSIIATCLERLRAGGGPVLAVVRDDPVLIGALASLGCEWQLNARADEGVGTSIAAGVSASSRSDGWLIALGDMPYLKPQTVLAVKEGISASTIAIPAHAGNRGHPVGFGGDFGSELAVLRGDRGARAVVEKYARCIRVIEVDDAGVLEDIDFPADIR